MIRAARAFRRDVVGSTSIEFAAMAMILLLMIMGVVEGGLLYWSWDVLEGAAIDAARCAAINAPSCQNVATAPASTRTYAASAALARGLSGVTASNVTVVTGTATATGCGNSAASFVSVALSYQFGPAFLVPLPTSLTASACFPLAS